MKKNYLFTGTHFEIRVVFVRDTIVNRAGIESLLYENGCYEMHKVQTQILCKYSNHSLIYPIPLCKGLTSSNSCNILNGQLQLLLATTLT